MFIADVAGFVTLYREKRTGLFEMHELLLALSRIFFTDTGVVVPGITAKFV